MSLPGMPKCYSQAITNVATTVNIRLCRALVIQVDSGQDIYVTFDGTTPTVNGANCLKIPAGTQWQSPQNINMGIDSFKYIGSAATGHLSVFAA